MVFYNYDKVGIKLDKVFNAHNDKTREGQGGTCMRCANDITKNHRKRNRNLQKGNHGHSVRGTTGHEYFYTSTIPPATY